MTVKFKCHYCGTENDENYKGPCPACTNENIHCRQVKMSTTMLNQLAHLIHRDAIEKGFYEGQPTVDELMPTICNNLHDEVSELHESWRRNKLFQLCDKKDEMLELNLHPLNYAAEELADIIIRALDDAAFLGIDIASAVEIKMRFNKKRPYKNGGKKC